MIMKKIFVAISLLACSYSALADNSNDSNKPNNMNDSYVVKKVFEKDNKLHVVLDLPYQKKMHGMLDDDEQSVERSKNEGAALQFFIPHPGIEEAQVDKTSLVQEIDDFVSKSAQYFKFHPQYKGMLAVNFVIFPGYKKPFQVDLSKISDPEMKQGAIEFNKKLKESSRCNKEQFCQVTASTNLSFLDSNNQEQELNKEEFAKFMEAHKGPIIDTYTSNKNYLYPIPYYVYIGTNGYLITHEQMEVQLQKLKNEFSKK